MCTAEISTGWVKFDPVGLVDEVFYERKNVGRLELVEIFMNTYGSKWVNFVLHL